jgi:hypothetical protein
MKRSIMDVVSPGDEPEETVTDFTDTESDDTESDDSDDTDSDTDTDTDVNSDAEWESFDNEDVAGTGSTTTGSTTKD